MQDILQGWAKEWALGCVNPASWLPPAAGGEFTQPRAHSFAHLCIQCDHLCQLLPFVDMKLTVLQLCEYLETEMMTHLLRSYPARIPSISAILIPHKCYTACGHSIAHRKWKETKLQPGTAGIGNMLGRCLVSFHFMWAILCLQAVLY